ANFGGNSAGTEGGGLYNGGTMSVRGSHLDGKSVTIFNGGALFNDGAPTVRGRSPTNKKPGKKPCGAIRTPQRTLAVIDSIFSGNTAVSGGAILNFKGTLTVQNSVLFGNTATFGGAIFNFQGTITISRSHIFANTASVNGGGISNSGGTVTVNK